LGDHDPSGIDMTRDLRDRLSMLGAKVSVERIALNKPQIDQYNPPPNPAKTTDTRYKSYMAEYGVDSWELDALEPKTLDNLICTHILKYLDLSLFKQAKVRQDRERDQILELIS
jgi:hypothetical protein